MNFSIGRIVLILAIVWLVAGSAIWWSRSQKPTPEKVVLLIERSSLDGRSESERLERIESVSSMMMRLNFEQRQSLRRSGEVDEFFASMNDQEQSLFLDRTLPQGFREMMQAINAMDPKRRKRLVERAINDFEQGQGLEPRGQIRLSEENRKKIVNEGLSSFYQEANAEVKMEFAPLLEQMQRAAQNLR